MGAQAVEACSITVARAGISRHLLHNERHSYTHLLHPHHNPDSFRLGMASHLYVVTEDDPTRDLRAGDLLEWNSDGDEPKLYQMRHRAPGEIMSILVAGTARPLADAAPDLLRQSYVPAPAPARRHLRLMR